MRCSAFQKEQLIVLQLWPHLFYAAGILHVTAVQFQKLRTAAVRSLGHGKAGASPLVRLSCLGYTVLLDPEAFWCWRTLVDFRRLPRKQSGLVQLWERFMNRFDGTLLPGPCSFLVQLCQLLGWNVIDSDAPCILDHHGLQFDLLRCSRSSLWRRFQNAWYTHVSHQLRARTSYAELYGLDWPLSHKGEERLPPAQVARLAALREGAFLTSSQQSRFDVIKDGTCSLCGQLDDLEHRCTSCPSLLDVYAEHQEACGLWLVLPTCLTHHLLAPANPWQPDIWRCLETLPDVCLCLQELTPFAAVNLFTDGSCSNPDDEPLRLAGWAAISVERDSLLASAPLAGWEQRSSRAELTAALAVLLWAVGHQVSCAVWTDSAYVAQGFWRLAATPEEAPFSSHTDIWQRILELLGLAADFRVVHIPSHGPLPDLIVDVDDWCTYWNDKADRAALAARQSGSQETSSSGTGEGQVTSVASSSSATAAGGCLE